MYVLLAVIIALQVAVLIQLSRTRAASRKQGDEPITDPDHTPEAPLDPVASKQMQSRTGARASLQSKMMAKQPTRSGVAGTRCNVKVLEWKGSPDHDWQDAAAFKSEDATVAIADGVTISICQQEWAEILTRSFVERRPQLQGSEEREAWWDACVGAWHQRVEATVDHWRSHSAEHWVDLGHWRRGGASATFAGFYLEVQPDGSLGPGYYLYTVGDCCAFWIDGRTLIRQEPPIIKFNNEPRQLVSRMEFPEQDLEVFPRSGESRTIPSTHLLLATDAVAEYLVTYQPWQTNTNFWDEMWRMDNRAFGDWAENLKREKALKPDDYTLALVCFER